MLNQKQLTKNIDLEALKERGKKGRQRQRKFLSGPDLDKLGVEYDEAGSEKILPNSIAKSSSKISS